MAYSDPQSTHNPTTGQIIPASWGDIVRDDLEYLARNKPHCRVYHSANTSIATSTVSAVLFNSERYDIGGCHSTSSNTTRLTVPAGEAGKYAMYAHASFDANVTGGRAIYLRLNGSLFIAGDSRQAVTVASAPTDLSIYSETELTAGAFVEMVVFQSSGGALNLLSSSAYSPEFGMRWVGV